MYANLAIKVDFPEPIYKTFYKYNQLAYNVMIVVTQKVKNSKDPVEFYDYTSKRSFFPNVYANLAIKVDFPEPTRHFTSI